MPPDYICHQCSFVADGCEICLGSDILPIPIGELDGGPKPQVKVEGVVFTDDLRKEIIVARKL